MSTIKKTRKNSHLLYDKILTELSSSIGGDAQELKNIVDTQFEFVHTTMRKGEFETVRLPYLGKFHVKLTRLQLFNARNAIQGGELPDYHKHRIKAGSRIRKNNKKGQEQK